ncbi:MAG: P-type conjugative transfer protein TrbJ [Burkholderiaceae bacterium]
MDRRMVIRAGIVSTALVLSPGVKAGAVIGATEPTQLLNHVELIANYLKQVQKYINMVRRYQNMLQNTDFASVLANVVPPDMRALVTDMRTVVQGGQAISYAMANHRNVFRNKYKDFGAFAAATYGKVNFDQDYKDWSQTTNDSIVGALQAAGVQMDSFTQEQQVMDQINSKLNSQSRNELLSAGGQIASLQVTQLQKLRALLASDMQITSAYFAQQNALGAAAVAETEKRFNITDPGNTPPIVGNEARFGF